tara:strand:+ start:636 stop:1016 length:381 start_codon:yes stop_codon:yes gene_type:complete
MLKEGQKYQISDYSVPDATLTICKIEEDPTFGRVVHLCLDGVMVTTPYSPLGFTTWLAHIPFTEEAVEESVGELICENAAPHNWEKSYREWKTAFENRKAHLWMTTVSHALLSLAKSLENNASDNS